MAGVEGRSGKAHTDTVGATASTALAETTAP